MKLPKRVFNSPLIEYANFEDGSHINLIRLFKPYANGTAYVVSDTKNVLFKQFKDLEKAERYFDSVIEKYPIKKVITQNLKYKVTAFEIIKGYRVTISQEEGVTKDQAESCALSLKDNPYFKDVRICTY